MRLLFLGFGTVGQGLAELLLSKRDELKRRYCFDWTVTGIADALSRYFAGDLDAIADLPVRFDRGTPFQQEVWAALRTIPYGETRSYGQIAEQIGSPGASRAVGLANGRNPIGIIVPCHRVIGSTGGMTGYGGGIDRKRALLALEKSRKPADLTLFE